MNEGFKSALSITGVVLGVLFFIFSLLIPAMYFDGKGKAAYIKQTQGIDLKWYEACAIDVKAGSADVRIEK